MANEYTLRNAKADGLQGLINGVIFTSIYSVFRVATDKITIPGADIKDKARSSARIFGSNYMKLTPMFIGTSLVYGYAKKKGYNETYSILLASAVGFALLYTVKL